MFKLILTLLLIAPMIHTQAVLTDSCIKLPVYNLEGDPSKSSSETELPKVTCGDTSSDTFSEDKVCGKYWKAKSMKTCCNQDELAARVTKVKERLSSRYKKRKAILKTKLKTLVGTKLTKVITRMKNAAFKAALVTQLGALATANTATSRRLLQVVQSNFQRYGGQKTMITSITSSTATAPYIEGLTTELEGFKAESWDTRITKMKAAYGNCYIERVKARIGGLCLRTSNKIADYWDSTNMRYKVTKAFCQKMVKNCAPVMSVNAVAQRISSILTLLKYLRVKTTTESDVFTAALTGSEITTLKSCGDNPDACSQDDTKRKSICRMITLDVENPMVQLNLEAETTADGEADETAVTVNTRRVLEKKAGRFEMRGLQTVNKAGAGECEEVSSGGSEPDDAGSQSGQTVTDPDPEPEDTNNNNNNNNVVTSLPIFSSLIGFSVIFLWFNY